ncbi:protein-methionine-sulfoxide reductase catalytic subunit MsrP [Salinarimonas soli]|uniref:Protein-methionine-sulfoxide reductase catalytic subunit MsrP n=1 Tax=Salinarimonas soli TaxID=1638099 RepID=A0A5B2VE79_9HYPH|nr:protein-methionine-sulfoxide reductase catalytic subunit MsrP [Salinarimonas soli]KAA2236732.1 protein-methionine-sulfoxide reductase catalytic subunit MsrP [Salinarimonas soli]
MLIRRPRGWEIPESQATPESVVLDRRSLLAGAGAVLSTATMPAYAQGPDLLAGIYPAKRNERFALDRPVTPEAASTTYNNYYEFGSSKSVVAAAKSLQTRPWTVTIDGLVEKPIQVSIEDLVRQMPVEERLYRHRCVEAWAMAVPWTGFPMKALLDMAKPLSGAKYVRMQTFQNPKVAPGQRQTWYPWPYTEGLTIEEAANDLTFLATGVYGKPLPNQMGAPLRLAVPWKYGFKSIKSIDRITLAAERPKSFWEALQAEEYGFWANVNPEVPHPRWSQATERMLGTDEMRPTLPFNGYGEYVAELYKGKEGEKLYL